MINDDSFVKGTRPFLLFKTMNRDQFTESSSQVYFHFFLLFQDLVHLESVRFQDWVMFNRKEQLCYHVRQFAIIVITHHGVLTRAILKFRGPPLESIRNSKDCILEQNNSSMNVSFVSGLVTSINNRSKCQLFHWPILATSFFSHPDYLKTTMQPFHFSPVPPATPPPNESTAQRPIHY